MSKKSEANFACLKSRGESESSDGKKIARLAVFTALSVVTNAFVEIKLFDLQFSITMASSALIGLFLGGGQGFIVCVLGDFIGFLINNWGQVFMPWVGISTGLFALFASIFLKNREKESKKAFIARFSLYVLTTFFACTICVNSVGFYCYNKYVVGFQDAFDNFASTYFGGGSGFLVYVVYRLFFKGQIWNSVANYALLAFMIPFFKRFFKKNSVEIREPRGDGKIEDGAGVKIAGEDA